MNLEQLKLALNLHLIQRFQTHRMQQKKSVAEHSFRVGALYSYLGGKELEAAYNHDLEEAVTGDLPSPIKKDLQGLEKYEAMRPAFSSDYEKKLGKIADKLELVLDLKEQMEESGHLPKRLLIIYEDELDSALDLAKEIGKIKEVKQLLKDIRR